MLIYMQTYQRDELDDLIVKYDYFQWSSIARAERERLQKIKNIHDGVIGEREKKILIDHKVFIGATAEMAELALDAPKFSFQGASVSKDALGNPVQTTYLLVYIYFIGDDKRPTVFIFECTKNTTECADPSHHKDIFALKHAFKKPTIDLGNPQELLNAP